MHEEPTPTFVAQLQQAIDRGQVVLITPPVQRSDPRPVPAMPMHRDEAALAAIFALLFRLTTRERRVLVHLATHEVSSKEQLLAAAACNTKTSALGVTIHKLRKRLKTHGIELTTLHGLGYGFNEPARARICDLVARYDRGVISTHAAPKPIPDENDQQRE